VWTHSAVIFGGGALLAFAAMVWPHDAVELQAYWGRRGHGTRLLVCAAAMLGCLGYGSVFLAVGLYVRHPIIPAAVLLAWEGAHGLPQTCRRSASCTTCSPSVPSLRRWMPPRRR